MSYTIILWASAALLFLLCFPLASTRKFVLEVFALILRVSMWAVLIAGGVLWFRPELLPAECANFVSNSPELSRYLPAPGTQSFGLVVAILVAGATVPCLAMLDVTRRIAGERLRQIRKLADAASIAPAVVVRETTAPVPVERTWEGSRRVVVRP